MGEQVPPIDQIEFRGVYTADNPLNRPRNTASTCENFRVMPGGWLRMRGGRKGKQILATAAIVKKFHMFRDQASSGSNTAYAQLYVDATDVRWCAMNASTLQITETALEAINVSWGFTPTDMVASCNAVDKTIWYNGWGTRWSSVGGGTAVAPPLSYTGTNTGGKVYYFGIDLFTVEPSTYNAAAPTVAFTAGAGYNTVANQVTLWVGIYNAKTAHYSNAVKMGTITTTGATGTITVDKLERMITAYHASPGSDEQSNLYWVFYSTVDKTGASVPYMIMASSGPSGIADPLPYKVAVTNDTASLSIETASTLAPNGYYIDTTREMPRKNFPPRPMKSICYANGRIYGVLLNGGTPVNPFNGFSYVPEARELCMVVWSGNEADVQRKKFQGDPLQCWPLENQSPTPSGEQPVIVHPYTDGSMVLVLTATSAFLLQEVADGLHEWPVTISRIHGTVYPNTVRTTPYGVVWVNQRNQIVMLPTGSTTIEVLSRPYQSLLPRASTKTLIYCANYIVDPAQDIDRYQVWCRNPLTSADSYSVVHDFLIGGQGYSENYYDGTNHGMYGCAADTAVSAAGVTSFLVADSLGKATFTHESQPATSPVGEILASDERVSSGAFVAQSIANATYERNWDSFDDPANRKEIPHIDIVGDGAVSTALGARPLTVYRYLDFEKTDANAACNAEKRQESEPDQCYRFRAKKPAAIGTTNRATNGFWYKWKLVMQGHTSDDSSFATYANPATQGDITNGTSPRLIKNFYGCIVRALISLGITKDRP